MPQDSLRLLALDGGGVRGLSSLMILAQLMETINPDDPPKPCDYFDMIAGTSTGGLIAVMLGRLQMNINDCIDAYLSLSSRVFEKKAHRVNIKGKLQGRFDSVELEHAIKDTIAQSGLDKDALLKDKSDAKCKVFVCATSKETSEIVNLTSFKSPHVRVDLLDSVEIWEACRATSAASTFFDPIAIGPYQEEFIDGATGANNPVQELWNQAQSVWGLEPIENRIQCLVSIGTGIPSLKPFRDDVLGIGQTLAAIAAETEQTAQRFQRDKSSLDDNHCYFRFNVVRGLEDIGLEESQKRKEMAAATGRYVNSSDVVKQMQACAKSTASRQKASSNIHDIPLSLEGVPISKEFIGRPTELQKLCNALLPNTSDVRRRVHVLRGLGGIGKTQLAVAFMRKHKDAFGAIFWLDGSSGDTLKQSIAAQAKRIPPGQIRTYDTSGSNSDDVAVKEVLGWLARPKNNRWLLVFDNVDRDIDDPNDPLTYNLKEYFPDADHGSILVTTRLTALERVGSSQEVRKVDAENAQAILNTWCKDLQNDDHAERLLELLDGLPLAITQAGAYIQQSGISILDNQGIQLDDYADRSIWTTWTMSYHAVFARNEHAANLLLLWSYCNRNDFEHDMLIAAEEKDSVKRALAYWIGDIASCQSLFREAMRLLRSYSLIDGAGIGQGYAMHAVVHQWAYLYCNVQHQLEIGLLALVVISNSVLTDDHYDSIDWNRRMLPHAQTCLERVFRNGLQDVQVSGDFLPNLRPSHIVNEIDILDAIGQVGILYRSNAKFAVAEKLYKIALRGFEKRLGMMAERALNVVSNIGSLYRQQDQYEKAEMMYDRALHGYKETLGADHKSTLIAAANLGDLYTDQALASEEPSKLKEAEKIYLDTLQVLERTIGPKNVSTIDVANSLSRVYRLQHEHGKAEEILLRSLSDCKDVLGARHTLTIRTSLGLGACYINQGKLKEGEDILLQSLRSLEGMLDPDSLQVDITATNLMLKLGNLYTVDRPDEAIIMYEKALAGIEIFEGDSSWRYTNLKQDIDQLKLAMESESATAEEMPAADEEEVANEERVSGRWTTKTWLVQRFKRRQRK